MFHTVREGGWDILAAKCLARSILNGEGRFLFLYTLSQSLHISCRNSPSQLWTLLPC